jgi:hypothetical protein
MTPAEKALVEKDLNGDAEDSADAQKALANGNVIDEVYEIREAMQFVIYDGMQLGYFLRTSDDSVFFWEDEESEDLWDDDKSIFDSKSRPLNTMIITTTITGDIEFDIRFEGRPVPIVAERVLMKKDGEVDIEDDDFQEGLAWGEIEAKFRRPPSFWDRLRRIGK